MGLFEEMEIVELCDGKLDEQVCKRLDDLTKPPGSLGRLEEFVRKVCAVRGSVDTALKHPYVFTFAGDHGITEERITPFPPEVTRQMVTNMASGGAAVSVMCKTAGVEYAVVDVGVVGAFEEHPKLIRRKVREGTRNFRREPAMTDEECLAAMTAGMDVIRNSECDFLGIGDMGIGNTASSSALYSLLLDLPASETVGMGTGSKGEVFERKLQSVEEGVRLHSSDWDSSGFDALRRVGGLEIAGMAGAIFGAAEKRIPVVVDGFIASAAALTAMRMRPELAGYLFFSHSSAEKFHTDFLSREGLRPVLCLDLRLGEGTGAVLAMQVILQAMACYNGMATFSGAGVSHGS